MKYLTLETELAAMKELNITPNELKLIQYILFAQDDNTTKIDERGVIQNSVTPAYKLLYDYMTILRSNGISLIETINSLKDRGIINKTTTLTVGQAFRPEDIDFNKRKLGKFLKSPLEMFYALWDNYPTTATINGAEQSIMNCVLPSIGVNGPDDLAILYGKKIKNNPALHAEVLELLDWGKSAGLINKTLLNFVLNEEWRCLRKQRDEGKVDNTCRRATSREL